MTMNSKRDGKRKNKAETIRRKQVRSIKYAVPEVRMGQEEAA